MGYHPVRKKKKTKLQKKITELKEQLQKMTTAKKQAEKETTPSSGKVKKETAKEKRVNQETAKSIPRDPSRTSFNMK